MKRCRIVLLIAIITFGCASTSSFITSENQEEQIQKLLVGTWSGYIKDTTWYHMINPDITLQISGIRKGPNGWTVNANLNWRSLEYIELYVYSNTVMLKMMDRYGGLYTLKPYRNTHLLGNVIYDRGRWLTDPHDIVLEKISR